jgi:ATP-dependent Clp protease ATP-binding subunit ClpB
MDLNRLTEMSATALREAQTIARRRNHNEVDTLHLLAALLTQEGGVVEGVLRKLEIPPGAVSLALERELDRLPRVTGSVDASKLYVTQAVNDALTRAEDEAGKLKDEFVSVEHLLLGLIDVGRPETLKKLFASFGLERNKVLNVLREVRGRRGGASSIR